MLRRTVNILLLIILIALPIYVSVSCARLDKAAFLCPIDYNGDMIIRSDSRGKGYFAAPRSGRRVHQGIDLYALLNTPVMAARSGRIKSAKFNKGMGNYVVIQHAGDLTTIYGHLAAIYVRDNDFVRQGAVLGTVGKTGNADHPAILPHLHFEVRKDGVPRDPLEYLE